MKRLATTTPTHGFDTTTTRYDGFDTTHNTDHDGYDTTPTPDNDGFDTTATPIVTASIRRPTPSHDGFDTTNDTSNDGCRPPTNNNDNDGSTRRTTPTRRLRRANDTTTTASIRRKQHRQRRFGHDAEHDNDGFDTRPTPTRRLRHDRQHRQRRASDIDKAQRHATSAANRLLKKWDAVLIFPCASCHQAPVAGMQRLGGLDWYPTDACGPCQHCGSRTCWGAGVGVNPRLGLRRIAGVGVRQQGGRPTASPSGDAA